MSSMVDKVARSYVMALKASPLVQKIAGMLKKKLGPRLEHYRGDVESLVSSVLNHRDLHPILEDYLSKSTHNEYILDRINTGFPVSYHKGILTFAFTVLGESYPMKDDSEDGYESDAVLSLFDPSKADRSLERATGGKLTFIGKPNGEIYRDSGDRQTYMKYQFKISLPMPSDLLFP